MTAFLAAGLIVPFLAAWATFLVVYHYQRQNPGIRTLTDRKWLSFVLAVADTGLLYLAYAYLTDSSLDDLTLAVILTVPAYAAMIVNGVFLYLTVRGEW